MAAAAWLDVGLNSAAWCASGLSRYGDHDWRRGHRGYGRYPENELWEAVEGYLDLVDASRSSKPDT
jgi:hypothetical protein